MYTRTLNNNKGVFMKMHFISKTELSVKVLHILKCVYISVSAGAMESEGLPGGQVRRATLNGPASPSPRTLTAPLPAPTLLCVAHPPLLP